MKRGDEAVSTERYTKKKDAIIAAATIILNQDGARGMTLAKVAARVGLITTSVTYYFKKKDDLAVACFLRTIARLEEVIAAASAPADPRARVRLLLANYLALDRAIREGAEPPIAVFSDLRTLNEPQLSVVAEAYLGLFRKARALLEGPGTDWMSRAVLTARTHVLLEQLYWSAVWLPRMDVDEYPRIEARMFDILLHGLAPEGTQWAPQFLGRFYPEPADAQERQSETFLIAATRLINQRGYRGASVERISEQLNVTKGSFYHHNDAKDDLVIACFERSFAIVRAIQICAAALPGTLWDRLSAIAATMVDFQLSERGPLLRTSSLAALPEDIRYTMVGAASRLSVRFAGMIADGIAQGSIRAIDPMIGAQMLNATLNATSSMGAVLPGVSRSDAVELYARPILMGLFAR